MISPPTPDRPRRRGPRLSQAALLAVTVSSALLLAGCRQDMHDQAKYEPLEASTLFANGASSRVPPAFTVAQGSLDPADPAASGVRADGTWVNELPMPLDAALLARGQERFNIYCSPCHDTLGTGRGMIVRRGFYEPPTYHQERLRDAPLGYIYDVISNGYGKMSGYGAQVKPRDRWAIAAWIRVLQRARYAPQTLLTANDRERVAEGWVDPAVLPTHGGGHGEAADHDGGHAEGEESGDGAH